MMNKVESVWLGEFQIRSNILKQRSPVRIASDKDKRVRPCVLLKRGAIVLKVSQILAYDVKLLVFRKVQQVLTRKLSQIISIQKIQGENRWTEFTVRQKIAVLSLAV